MAAKCMQINHYHYYLVQNLFSKFWAYNSVFGAPSGTKMKCINCIKMLRTVAFALQKHLPSRQQKLPTFI